MSIYKRLPHKIKMGEIVAPRVWRIDENDLVLESLFHAFEWPVQTVVRAKDFRCPLWLTWDEYSHDLLPAESVEGFYAWKTPEQALEYAIETELYLYEGATLVLGEVELFGNIIEHTRGYRGELAAIASLTDVYPAIPENIQLFKKIKKKYFPHLTP